MKNEKEEIKKITLELTEFELFKLEQIIKVGIDGLQSLELNMDRGNGLKNAHSLMRFSAKVLTQMLGVLSEDMRYENAKILFDMKMVELRNRGVF